MRAGRLSHPVVVEEATETANSYGEMIEAWSDYADAWAEIEPISGAEAEAAAHIEARLTHRVRIRAAGSVTPAMRIRHGLRIFAIVSVCETDERGAELVLLCEERPEMSIATLLQYARDAMVCVERGDTDAANGGNLLTAYATAKALTPGGNALSATNRAVVLIPPGKYALAATLTLNADFVDLIALTDGAPAATWVTSALSATITQAAGADDVRLAGFTIHNSDDGTGTDNQAFKIAGCSNDASCYWHMHFRHDNAYTDMRSPCVAVDTDLGGTWEFCEGDDHCWRMDTAGGTDEFKGLFRDCVGGTFAFGCDQGVFKATCLRCRGGNASFGSCWNVFLGTWDAAALLEDCVGGDRSYGIAATVNGSFYRCRGGDYCFGGDAATGNSAPGRFNGYAEDCTATDCSFGAGIAGAGDGFWNKMTGTLRRCRLTAAPEAMRLEATSHIDGCVIEVTGANADCLYVLASGPRVYNSTLIANGTGKTIDAGGAVNALLLHCRCNLDKGANVTNLVGGGALSDGYCIVDSDVDAG